MHAFVYICIYMRINVTKSKGCPVMPARPSVECDGIFFFIHFILFGWAGPYFAADEIRIHTHTHTHTHNRKLLAAADEISSEAQHVIPKRCQSKKSPKRNQLSATPPALSRPLFRSILIQSIRALLI